MKKYILLVVSAVALAFTSCSDKEEIEIFYQNEIEIKVDQLMSSFRESYDDDFEINEYHSIRVQSYIYNEAGELVASTKNYVQNYSASTKFSHKLQDGKYTIMTFADFVEGESSPKSDNDVTFSSWNIKGTNNLNDLEITSSGKIAAWFYEVMGATKTELVIDGTQTKTSISVKPITCLLYFDIDYINESGQYLRAETLEIIGERTNNMANWSGNEWEYDSSFKIGSKTRVISINPMEDIEDGYIGYIGYRAFMPTKDMRFWFTVDVLTNDGEKISIDSSDEDNFFTSTYYTDTYDFEAGKQYVINMSCTDLSMTLTPFSSTSSRAVNKSSKTHSLENVAKTTYKVTEILK